MQWIVDPSTSARAGYRVTNDGEAIKLLIDPRTSERTVAMTAWTSGELSTIAATEELNLASVRTDGTLRRPVTMWVVRHDNDVYVRSVNGRESSWFRGALSRHQARVRADGVEKDVDLIETDEGADAVDAAYHAKYGRRYPTIVPSIIAPGARAATLKLVPR